MDANPAMAREPPCLSKFLLQEVDRLVWRINYPSGGTYRVAHCLSRYCTEWLTSKNLPPASDMPTREESRCPEIGHVWELSSADDSCSATRAMHRNAFRAYCYYRSCLGKQLLEGSERLKPIVPYLRPRVQYFVLGLDPVLLVLARPTTTLFVELIGAFSDLGFQSCAIGDRHYSWNRCFRGGDNVVLCRSRCVGISHAEPPVFY